MKDMMTPTPGSEVQAGVEVSNESGEVNSSAAAGGYRMQVSPFAAAGEALIVSKEFQPFTVQRRKVGLDKEPLHLPKIIVVAPNFQDIHDSFVPLKVGSMQKEVADPF